MILAKAQIGDYDKFWSVFTTKGAEQRSRYGSKGSQVFRNASDPGEVYVLFDWSAEQYAEFLADPKTPEIMGAAGLQGPPDHVVLEDAGSVPS